MKTRTLSHLKHISDWCLPGFYGKLKYARNSLMKKDVTLLQLADVLINKMNLARNDIVMVHTSFHFMKMIDSSPEDLIFLLKMIVGTEGTLILPTFTKNHYKILYSSSPYNNRTATCSTGLINEVFRLMPDTVRSCHPLKSVAVWGKNADYLIRDHYKSEYAFDENSPFYKLYLLKAKIIGIGVPLANFSFLHSVDDTNDSYFPTRYSEPILKEFIDSNGEKHTGFYRHNLPEIVKVTSPYKIVKHFKENEMKEFKIRGIPFFKADAEKVYDRTLSLAKNGITIYK